MLLSSCNCNMSDCCCCFAYLCDINEQWYLIVMKLLQLFLGILQIMDEWILYGKNRKKTHRRNKVENKLQAACNNLHTSLSLSLSLCVVLQPVPSHLAIRSILSSQLTAQKRNELGFINSSWIGNLYICFSQAIPCAISV